MFRGRVNFELIDPATWRCHKGHWSLFASGSDDHIGCLVVDASGDFEFELSRQSVSVLLTRSLLMGEANVSVSAVEDDEQATFSVSDFSPTHVTVKVYGVTSNELINPRSSYTEVLHLIEKACLPVLKR